MKALITCKYRGPLLSNPPQNRRIRDHSFIPVIKNSLYKTKTLLNNPNFRIHLFKIGWTWNSHILSWFRRFRTLRCWPTELLHHISFICDVIDMQDANRCQCRVHFKNGERTCRLRFFQETWNFRKLPSTAIMQSTCCRRTTQHLSLLLTKYPVQRNSSSQWTVIVVVRREGPEKATPWQVAIVQWPCSFMFMRVAKICPLRVIVPCSPKSSDPEVAKRGLPHNYWLLIFTRK